MMRTSGSEQRTEAFALLARATGPEQVFAGADPARTYRRLARLVHPDTCPQELRDEAGRAFAQLGKLWAAHRGDPQLVRITTRARSYSITGLAAKGDLANLYAAQVADTPGTVLLKMPRHPRNNDLVAAEAAALSQLAEQGDPAYRAYFPQLVETFRHRDAGTGTDRRVNVVHALDGFTPLSRVRQCFPAGLDPRDAAWMWRRLLVALGAAHRAGLVHGAVLPEHVLIHPGSHGLVLLDWCYATTDGPVPAVVPRYRPWYPAEVTARQPACAATDIFLASRTMAALLGDRAPAPMRAFLAGCTLPAAHARPQDAWDLLGELDELLHRLYGPRRFRPFTLPDTA